MLSVVNEVDKTYLEKKAIDRRKKQIGSLMLSSTACAYGPSLVKDIKRTGHIWIQLERIAQERGDWRVFIGGLCSGRSEGQN